MSETNPERFSGQNLLFLIDAGPEAELADAKRALELLVLRLYQAERSARRWKAAAKRIWAARRLEVSAHIAELHDLELERDIALAAARPRRPR